MITGRDMTISSLVWDAGYLSDDREISNNLAANVNLRVVDDVFLIVTEETGFEAIEGALNGSLPGASHWKGGTK